MSFWNTSEGEAIGQTEEYEAPGGSFETFPDNTDVMAYIDEIKWQENKPEYGGGRYINYRICVTQPETYKNRKSYFKLWVNGDNPKHKDPKKQGDTHKRLLGAMATNAGGGLFSVDGEPTDEQLAQHLSNKLMVFKLGAYELDGEDGKKVTGNYVKAVSPKTKTVEDVKPQSDNGGTRPASRDLDDSIPF